MDDKIELIKAELSRMIAYYNADCMHEMGKLTHADVPCDMDKMLKAGAAEMALRELQIFIKYL